jgi:apolipoprotein N-acyltransferase
MEFFARARGAALADSTILSGDETISALGCAILTAAGCYFSFGLGNVWWLAWLAPVPVLWLVFGETRGWKAFLIAWSAFALGLTNLVRAYGNVFPGAILALDILVPSLLFALAAMGARRVDRTLGPVPAMFAFAALWAGYDLLVSFYPGLGSIVSPAGAEVAAPILIQSAALGGFAGVTFMLGTVAAGIALSLRTGNPAPVVIAAGLLAANAAYGYLRISHPPAEAMRVALIDSNTYGYWDSHRSQTDIGQAALKVVDAYTAQIEKLGSGQVRLVVLPENVAQIAEPWREEARVRLATAADTTGATVVGGFNAFLDGARRNISWIFEPGTATPVVYEKRHLVPAVESSVFAPGPGPRVLAGGVEPEICFDMDFPRTIRRDAVAMHPRLLAVSASEIVTHGDWSNLGAAADDWFHARDAVLRSVENGVPMARSAGRGLLTLNDRYGRIVAETRTSGAFTTLLGDLPLDGPGGATLYDRIGDTFGWLCLGAGLVAASFRLPARRRPNRGTVTGLG